MPHGSPEFKQAMAFWGTVTAAAGQGKSAVAMQQMVSAEAERIGGRTSFATRAIISKLFSKAVALRESGVRLAAAPASAAITGAHISPMPFGAAFGGRAGPRVWDVRVGYAAIRGGQPEFDYITLRYTGSLPATVGELREEAASIAESLASSYGSDFIGMGSIQIGELGYALE